MTRMSILSTGMRRLRLAAFGAAALSVLSTPAARGEEKLLGTYGEARTILSFAVPDAAVQKLVPEGWRVVSITDGPAKGANLSLILVDALMCEGAGGKRDPLFRSVALRILAKKSDMQAPVIMNAGGFESNRWDVPGAYDFSFGAATIERTLGTAPDGTASAREWWQFRGDNGNLMELDLQFARDPALRSKEEFQVHSATDPNFYLLYRTEQAEDVVRSVPAGTNDVQKFAFKTAGPLFAQLFEGSERLISITSVPWYWRQIFAPDARSE